MIVCRKFRQPEKLIHVGYRAYPEVRVKQQPGCSLCGGVVAKGTHKCIHGAIKSLIKLLSSFSKSTSKLILHSAQHSPHQPPDPSQNPDLTTPTMSRTPDKPTWVHDIRPILVKKAKENKSNEKAVALGDYMSVVRRRKELWEGLVAPSKDPRAAVWPYKLSDLEKNTLTKWLDATDKTGMLLFMDINDPDQLKEALQIAVEVELATMPPYLTAMYSIDASSDTVNSAIRSAIRGVVMQEMKHFGLACNMLVSIGGAPDVISPQNIPEYPTALPGGLRGDLIVHLRKFSLDQVGDFMSIELPEIRRKPKEKNGIWYVDESCETEESDNTIGYMYDQILESIDTLYKSGQIMFGNLDKQIDKSLGIFKITSLEDARNAVNIIVDEGEGSGETGLDPVDDRTNEMAHYFRFSEMYYGRKIVRNDDPKTGFSYSGDEFMFDASGIYNMMDDPNINVLTNPSPQYTQALEFANQYMLLLQNLNTTFNGNPGNLGTAVGDMYTLKGLAPSLMTTDNGLGTGQAIGTPFQHPDSTS